MNSVNVSIVWYDPTVTAQRRTDCIIRRLLAITKSQEPLFLSDSCTREMAADGVSASARRYGNIYTTNCLPRVQKRRPIRHHSSRVRHCSGHYWQRREAYTSCRPLPSRSAVLSYVEPHAAAAAARCLLQTLCLPDQPRLLLPAPPPLLRAVSLAASAGCPDGRRPGHLAGRRLSESRQQSAASGGCL